MRLWLSIVKHLILEKKKQRLANADEEVMTSFRVWLADVDHNKHMNNASYVMSMEIARQKFTVRSGFLDVCMKNGWYGPVVAQSIIYFKPIGPFQHYHVGCKIVGVSDQIIFLRQNFYVKEKIYAAGLVKIVVKKGRETISLSQLSEALGYEIAAKQSPSEVTHWDVSNSELLKQYKESSGR